jgi:anti-anti-sigma regulatory factor
MAQREGGSLKLLKLTPRVGDTLKCSMLTGIFEIFENEAEALASFS